MERSLLQRRFAFLIDEPSLDLLIIIVTLLLYLFSFYIDVFKL